MYNPTRHDVECVVLDMKACKETQSCIYIHNIAKDH